MMSSCCGLAFRCLIKSKVQSLKSLALFSILGAVLFNPLGAERLAFAQSDFYQGKTIRFIVGYQPGDNHDQWVRFYARFLGKHIPGNPDFVVQNMPGAGGIVAANHLYNVAKPDGLTIAAIDLYSVSDRQAAIMGDLLKLPIQLSLRKSVFTSGRPTICSM